jgi:cell wall-associated NlpC family hydrolase
MAVIPTLAGFQKALKGTPMYGEAAAIYKTALRRGVNPAFVAGLAGAESSFGTAGYARGTKNPYGYGVYMNKKYRSYAEATDAMTKSLSGSLYKGAGLRSLPQIISRYSPASDGNNEGQHAANIRNMGGRTGGRADQVFVNASGQAVVGGQVVSDSPEQTQQLGQEAAQDEGMSLADTTMTSLAGRQPGESIFKTVVQGVVAAQFASQFKGQEAGSSLVQEQRPGLLDQEGEGNSTPVSAAKKHLGVPYSWGGGTPSGPGRGFGRGANTVGFDCSSLVQYAWAKAGVKLPRVTYDQIKVGTAVPNISQAKPGDLLFPSTGHVQMYIGNGNVIEAPRTGGHVQIVKARSKYIAIRRPG